MDPCYDTLQTSVRSDGEGNNVARVLVIGSAHLDIVADFDRKTEMNLDKIGELLFSVGGAAYNIAANLAINDCEVSVLSILKRNSLTGHVIANHLRKRRIGCQFLFEREDIPESGFIAHTCDHRLRSAVSCVAIEHSPIPDKLLDAATHWAEVVAIDTNLSVESIKKIALKCFSEKKPVYACCVSESKVSRLFRRFEGDQPLFQIVTMNNAECV